MQNKKRSSNYDWFRGNKKDEKNDLKANLKVTWKFTRIFLMFSIFFFSMWGCVQIFTHKTNPQPGFGVEIVNSSRYNPMRISVDVSNNPSAADPNKTTYTLSTPKTNTDLYANNNILNNIRNQFENKLGIPNWLDNSGKYASNTLLRFLVNAKPLTGTINSGGIASSYYDGVNKDDPVVHSTDVRKEAPYDNPLAPLNNFKFVLYTIEVDPDTKIESIVAHDVDFIPAYTAFMNDKTHTMIQKNNANFNMKVLTTILSIPVNNTTLLTYFQDANNHPQVPDEKLALKVAEWNTLVSSIAGKVGISVDIEKKETTINGDGFFANPGKTSSKIISSWSQAWTTGFGPFYGIFVYPIAFIMEELIGSMGFISGWESLIAIVLLVVFISIFMFGLSFKGVMQQTRMQELSAKKAIIDAKYAPYKGNKQMENRQRQEVAELYKKEGLSPLGSLSSVLITMPFFLAMWRVIGTNQHIKTTTWLNINFSATSWREFFGNIGSWRGWIYVPLIGLAAGLQVFSQLYPKLLTKRRDKNRINVQQKQAMKKSNKTQNIMIVIFAFFALTLTAGIQIYFIVRSLWRIFEVSLTHHILVIKKRKKIALKK